jgi:hypothetical protein
MCGVLARTALSSLDAHRMRRRPSLVPEPRIRRVALCAICWELEDSRSAAPDSSRRLHGAPTFGVARQFFCTERSSTHRETH